LLRISAMPGSGPMTGRELWTLVDSVRNRCYDIFVFAEKKRLHDLVCPLRPREMLPPPISNG
jgi:hypothetical protein